MTKNDHPEEPEQPSAAQVRPVGYRALGVPEIGEPSPER